VGLVVAQVNWALAMLDVVHALDLRDVILVGHSVSAMVAVLAANREPGRFERLILIGPSPRYVNDPPYVGGFERADIEGLLEMMDRNYIGWAEFLAPAIIKNADRPELGQELTESFCSTDPVVARRFAEATFLSDNRADLARVRVPSLILQCSDDMVAPLEVGDYLRRELPDSTLRVMKATGHCPHMSHPEETIELMREYLPQERGRHRTPKEYLPKRTPQTTLQLLAIAAHSGKHIGAVCTAIHRDKGEWGVRGILGVRALMRQHGIVAVEDACAAALEMGVPTYRFVRRYLERRPRPPLALRQVDPLIRQLTLYRDHINRMTKESPDEPR